MVLSEGRFMEWSIIKTTFAVILFSTITGCGVKPVKPVVSFDAAAAYGNITLPEGSITSVVLYKVGDVYDNQFKTPPQGRVFANGDFFFENLDRGKYYLVGFTVGKVKFDFNYRDVEEYAFITETAVVVRPGEVAYMGSYDVTGIDNNFQKDATFEIARSKTAARMLILKHLKEELQGSGWESHFDRAMM
jgi:hypothetical protein